MAAGGQVLTFHLTVVNVTLTESVKSGGGGKKNNMSRRLRIEEARTKQLKDELQEEEDKLKVQHQRIFGPLVWRRFQNGVKIEDLQADRFEEAIELVQTYFLMEDVIFRNAKMSQDPISLKCFADRLRFKLKDRASILAIDEETDKMVGVLILKPVQKCDFGRVYSRTMLVEGEPYRSVTEFLNRINRKVDVFQCFDCQIYLQYYLLCVHPQYRNNALGLRMMMVGYDVARHLKIPVVMGVFSNYRLQNKARKIGIDQVLYEYEYVRWQDKYGQLVFCDPGTGNYTCNVQGGRVPPPPTPAPIPAAGGGVKKTRKKT